MIGRWVRWAACVRASFVRVCAGSILVLAAVLSGHVSAQSLPSELSGAQSPLRESGAGRFRYFGFHVYDARLWVSGESFGSDKEFALGLRYAREIAGADLARSSADEIARLENAKPGDLERWYRLMRELFPTVRSGDELVGVHLPRVGARFFLNGRVIGIIPEPAFAQAFFAIWLDPRTRSPGLRRALLGERDARS